MGSFSSVAQGRRRLIAATAPAAAPRTSVAAEASRDGRDVFLLPDRLAAARAADFRCADRVSEAGRRVLDVFFRALPFLFFPPGRADPRPDGLADPRVDEARFARLVLLGADRFADRLPVPGFRFAT